MNDEREATVWDALNPVSMFRCQPADFCGYFPSICLGIYWMPGMVSLMALPFAGVWGCWQLWQVAGAWSLLTFVPFGLVWSWLMVADVAFRRQSPTRAERAGFDHAVVNWFGLFATMVLWPIATLAGTVALVVWCIE